MIKLVVKKNGSKEPFDAEKINKAIRLAGQAAGVEEPRIEEVIKVVLAKVFQLGEGKEEIASTEIKETVLEELDVVEPSISASWREYDQNKKA